MSARFKVPDDVIVPPGPAPTFKPVPAEIETTTDDQLADARAEAQQLTTRILELRDAYYERDTVLVSDEEYDRMLRRLEELERLYPELQSQDSPTQTVGGRAQTTLFAPVEHAERMLSLDNVFSLEEFEAIHRSNRGSNRNRRQPARR